MGVLSANGFFQRLHHAIIKVFFLRGLAMLGLSVVPFMAQAQTAGYEHHIFNIAIEPQSADEALIALGKQTNTSIIFNYELVKKYRTARLVGSFSIPEALDKLFEGTQLTYELDHGYIITEKATTGTGKASGPIRPPLDPLVNEKIEEVVVTGYVGSINRSLQKKRDAETITDGVSSEDLGKYPDQNVVEALQRIPGVSIDRNRGEGQFITVRGFGPQFNTLLYNGRILATENLGRDFSFDVLAAEVISGADIYKSASAKTEIGGIGSVINLAITKPMEHTGFHTVIRGEGIYDTLSEHRSPHYSGLVSYSNETWGAIFSLNYQKNHYEVESAQTDGWLLADLSYVENKRGPGNFSEAKIPRNIDFKMEEGTRKRIGGTLVLQWQPTEKLNITLDGLYSKYDIESHITSSANWTQNAGETLASAYLDEHNTLTSYEYKSHLDIPTDFVQAAQNRPTSTDEIGINAKWNAASNIDVNIDVSTSDAHKYNAGNNYFIVAGIPNANPKYTLEKGSPYPDISFDRPVSVNDLRSHIMYFEGADVADDITQISLDEKIKNIGGYISSLEIGASLSQRTKLANSYKTANGSVFGGYKYSLPSSLFSELDANHFLDGHVPNIWYAFDPYELTRYLWENTDTSGVNNAEGQTPRANGHYYGGSAPLLEPFNTWAVTEKPMGAYVQVNFDGVVGALPWSGNLGVRYEATEIRTRGNEQTVLAIKQSPNEPTAFDLTLSKATPVLISNSYENILPAANLKLNLNSEQTLEFGLSKSMTRPPFNLLIPGLNSFDGRVGANQVQEGNPYLTPYESNNVDIAWSWYYGTTRFLGVNYFYKSLTNFLTKESRQEKLLDDPNGVFLVTKPYNSVNSDVEGTELTILHAFDNGFGVRTNYTWVRNSAPFQGGSSNHFFLEGLSDSYNVVGFYEKGDFQAQISYNYRFEFLQAAIGMQSQPEMVEGYGQLDLSTTYKLSPNLSIMLEGINITDQKRRSFSIYRERLLNYSDSGSKFSIGLHGSF